MYYIHDYHDDEWKAFSTWWNMIEFFYDYDEDLITIAHNENDEYHYYRWDDNKLTRYCRQHIVYDENMSVVNSVEIKKSLRIFTPPPYVRRGSVWHQRYDKLNKYTYRYDPVPGMGDGNWNGGRFRTCIRKNKTYFAKLQEYYTLFPGDARIRRIEFVSTWNDDFRPSNKYGKSWKKMKVRKQWMKHI